MPTYQTIENCFYDSRIAKAAAADKNNKKEKMCENGYCTGVNARLPAPTPFALCNKNLTYNGLPKKNNYEATYTL